MNKFEHSNRIIVKYKGKFHVRRYNRVVKGGLSMCQAYFAAGYLNWREKKSQKASHPPVGSLMSGHSGVSR